MLNYKNLAIGASMLAAVAGTALAPITTLAASEGGTVLQQVLRHLRAADAETQLTIKGLERSDQVIDRAREHLADADKLADEVGVRDGRVDAARLELIEAEQSIDHARDLTRDAEQKIDAAIQQIKSEHAPGAAPTATPAA